MTLRHVVSWRLAATDDAERLAQATKIAAELHALKGVVPEILDLHAGPDVARGGNWDVTLVADFADRDALQRYVAHPAHQLVVTYVRGVVADRAAVDFEV